MTSGLSGLGGLSGYVNSDPEATAEQRLGGPANPVHGTLGEHATPYPWEVFPGETHGPYGLESDLIGMDIVSYETPAGTLNQDPFSDQQPLTHAAPWPKGVPQGVDPDTTTPYLVERAGIHGQNFGASRAKSFDVAAQQDDWREIYEVRPGETTQEDVPGQVKTGGVMGWGSTDRVQSYARQNSYGFDAAHMHRRYAAGSIPGNFMWLAPASRPMVRSFHGTARVPVGQDSPFYGQDPTQSYGTQGAVLTQLPVAYSPPPDPAQAQTYTGYAGEIPAVDAW